jgi:hypothetical protein
VVDLGATAATRQSAWGVLAHSSSCLYRPWEASTRRTVRIRRVDALQAPQAFAVCRIAERFEALKLTPPETSRGSG